MARPKKLVSTIPDPVVKDENLNRQSHTYTVEEIQDLCRRHTARVLKELAHQGGKMSLVKTELLSVAEDMLNIRG